MRLVRFLLGIFLLPLCVAATRSVAALIQTLQPASYNHLPASFWGLVIGFGLWIFLFLSLPRPMRAYVLGHELTHALWAWIMGARVSAVRVSKRGGSVRVTKDNFLITLAPYFFPFYTVCVLIIYYVTSLFVDQRIYEPFWLGCVGLSWAFHLTFTIVMFREHQPDIQAYGRLFSYTVIYLFNLLGIGLWIIMVASPTLEQFVDLLQYDIALVYSYCYTACLQGVEWATGMIKR